MARGRKSQPAEVKEAKGNPGQRRNVVVPETDLPMAGIKPPRTMSAAAKAVWNECAPALISSRILRQTDVLVFGVFCQTIADYRAAIKDIRKRGATYMIKSNHSDQQYIKINPMVGVRDRALNLIIRYGESLGLTPASRQRLQLGVNLPIAGEFDFMDRGEKQPPTDNNAITFN